MVIYAAIEGGGTAWKAALVDGDLSTVLEEQEFETTTPAETLQGIRSWLAGKTYDAIGIGSFGPIDARPTSPKYGFITSTPKVGWKDTDVLSLLGVRDSSVPFLFDTDVNAPAMAEYMYRKDASTSCAYITVGTGIGVGIVVNGQSIKGLMHPEGGHIPVARHPDDDFTCSCSFHQHCLEGYCNNLSIAQRLNMGKKDLASIPDDHPIWSYLAFYLAQLCANLVLIVSIERIFIGGGIMQRKVLLPLIRQETFKLLNGYIDHPSVSAEGLEHFISIPTWGNKAGLMGAAYLAKLALDQAAASK